MRLNKRDWLVLGIYLIFFLFFFKDTIFREATFCYRDTVRYYHPAHFYATEGVTRGIIPLWNPYIFSGVPFLATVQHALFYPFNLLHYLFPFTPGFKFLFIIHYFLAGLGLYLLLRFFSLSPAGALAGTLIFTFNGYMVSILNLLTTLSAVVWLAFGLLFFRRALSGGWLWLVLLCFTLILEFYSGQPEVMYFSLILLLAYSLYAFYRQQVKPARIALVLLVAGGLALVLLQPVLLLLKELLGLSVREKGVDYSIASYWSLHPLELITTFSRTFSWDFVEAKKWFRQTWLRSFYFGFITLFFVWLGCRSPEYKKLARFFIWLGLAGLIMALGKYTPVHSFLYKFLPGFNLVRYPVKYIFILNFSLVTLAGFGFESFLSRLKQEESVRRLAVFAGLVLLGYVLFYWFRRDIAGWLSRTYMPGAAPEKIGSLYQSYLPTMAKDYRQGLAFLLALLVWLLARPRIKETVFQLGLAVLLFGNLTSCQTMQDMEPLVKEEFYRDKPPVVHFLQEKLGMSRYVFEKEMRADLWLVDLLGAKLPLLSNMGMNYHLFDVGIYESLDLVKEENMVRVLQTQPNYSCTPLARMFGIRYIFTQRDDIKDAQLKFVGKMLSFQIYENRLILPRAILVPNAVVRLPENDIDTVNYLLSPEFDPSATVVLTGTTLIPGAPESARTASEDAPEIVSYDMNEVVLRTTPKQESWLVLFDTNYPGWQASVNGKKTEIYEANYLFRAIRVPAGELLIKFSYAPIRFSIGVLIGVFMLIILSFCAARGIRHPNKT
ncbi:MAG: YfhO family protein [Elusimicrobia bacterium]|nr:YfhO family protein [Elusimicrobiota bacterium]